MNKRCTAPALLLSALLLAGCSGVSDTRPDVVRSSERYLQQGVEAYGNSDYVVASDFFSKALAQYRSIDDLQGMLESRINLAETALAAGAHEAVKRQLEAAERVVAALGDSEYAPRLQLLRAQHHWRLGEQHKAMAALQPLLPAFDEEDRPVQHLDILMLSAVLLRTDMAFAELDGQAPAAAQWLRRLDAAFIRTSGTTELHEARQLRFQAQWAMHQGKLGVAERKFSKALTRYREAATRPAIAATLSESALLAQRQQQWPLAEERLLRALYIRVWILDRPGSAAVLEQLAELYTLQQREDAAREAAEWAQHIRTGANTDWRGLGRQFLQGPLAMP